MTVNTYGSGDGTVFIQPDGPNTKPIFGGCVDIGELDAPKGDAALWQCRDPKVAGGFNTSRVVRGAPGMVSTSFTTDVRQLATYFEELKDNTPVYLCLFDDDAGGHKDIMGNATRMFVTKWIGTNAKYGNLAVARADGEPDRGEFAVDVSGSPPLYAFYDLKELALRVSISEVNNVNAIAFSDIDGRDGFAACDATGAATANVLRFHKDKYLPSSDINWAATAADPLDADEHLSAIAIIQMDADTDRIIVANGVTDAAAPAEISYSDDDGVTWTKVPIGSTNAEFFASPHCIFALDRYNIWAASNLGRIYHSVDAGLSWTTEEDAVIHANDWLAITFADPLHGMAGGESDVLAYTSDGGATWAAVTATGGGAHINTIGYSGDFWWAGDAAGDLYFSYDNGTSWFQRGFDGDGAGAVKAVKFANMFFGVMLHDTAAPVGRALITFDGGYTWTAVTMPTNVGLNDVWIVGPRILYIVGEAQGGLGVLIKIESTLSNF